MSLGRVDGCEEWIVVVRWRSGGTPVYDELLPACFAFWFALCMSLDNGWWCGGPCGADSLMLSYAGGCLV